VHTKFDIYVFISDVRVFHFFKLHICRYLVHVLCFICHNMYLFTSTVVLHDINNHNDVSHLTITWRVGLVEQELLSLPEHLCSSPVFSGVRVAQSLVFCEVFCRSLFVFWSFSIGHCIVCLIRLMASDYPFWYLVVSDIQHMYFHKR
jgi:hypothetical protein